MLSRWTHFCLQQVGGTADLSALNAACATAQEYYSQILKKLKEVGAQGRQTDFYI
jgi:hypothetical protein